MPKYKLSRKSFRFYADDTHSGGRILDSNFQAIKTGKDGLRPILCVGGLLIQEKYEADFFAGFDSIRKKYADFLGSQDLPIIHMRQLWGKHPPEDKGKNPFSPVDYDTRFSWAREIVEYLMDVKSNGAEGYLNYTRNHALQQPNLVAFFSSEMMQNERKMLSDKFGGNMRKFYDIILNPLADAIGDVMANIDVLASNNDGNVEFIYDQSEASKGFDVLESYIIARDLGYLKNIKTVKASNTRSHTGLQCADVIAYINQRIEYAKYSEETDEGISNLMRGIKIPFVSGEVNSASRKTFEKIRKVSSMLHYELGIEALRKIDRTWIDENAYSPTELLHRMNTRTSFDRRNRGTNILRDEVHAAHVGQK